jgi:hypothetical protein
MVVSFVQKVQEHELSSAPNQNEDGKGGLCLALKSLGVVVGYLPV